MSTADCRPSWSDRPRASGRLISLLVMVLGVGWLVWRIHVSSSLLDSGVQTSAASRLKEIKRGRRLKELAQEDAPRELERRKWCAVIEATSRRLAGELIGDDQTSLRHVGSELARNDGEVFWSFQRLRSVSPPQTDTSSWARNGIDRFILRRLTDAGLQPSDSASQQVLARRLWYDLTGLPPTPEEMTPFLQDRRSDAYERLVEKLLSRPSFGERWARVWLDVARYADSNGYEEDELRPHAYPYRDFVIWAMYEDLPFDRFIQWQIAGDELQPTNPLAIAATGFITAGPHNTFMPQEIERRDELDDIVSTIGSATLGLTIGCARCHDHFYDPITTEEYYRLVAVFEPCQRSHRYLAADGGHAYRKLADPVEERREEVRQILLARAREDNIAALDFTEEEKDLLRQPLDPSNERQALLLSWCNRCLMVNDSFIDEETEPLPQDRARYDKLQAEMDALLPLLPEKPPMVLAPTGSEIGATFVLERGRLDRRGTEVGPGFLAALTDGEWAAAEQSWRRWLPLADEADPRGPRSALALWLTDVEHGAGSLLARVIVNRLWLRYFGRGLVATPSDFGSQGTPPTHPELLEWLASELVANNWRLKHIHRLIVNSATYRQTTTDNLDTLARDPFNELVSRRIARRMTAEMLRDSLLLVSGNLNRDMFGPGVFPPIPLDAIYNKENTPGLIWPDDSLERPAVWRRSIYVMHKRTTPLPLLNLFDAPHAGTSCGQRSTATVPTQVLALWNAPFVRLQAGELARRIIEEFPAGIWGEPRLKARVRRAYQHVFCRGPRPDEVKQAIHFLTRHRAAHQLKHWESALTDLCHTLLISNEFMFVD